MMTATTTRTTRTRTTTDTLITTATGTTTRTRTTTTTRTTTRTRKAPTAASEPEVPPSSPAAPAQEAGLPAEAAPPRQEASKPTAHRSPRAVKDPKDQDAPPAPTPPSEKTEVFEGVRIRVGSVNPRGGYVHWRSRRQVLADSLDLGIPPEVPHHPGLLTERQKPSEMGFKRTEKLIAQVKQAKARGEDPAPLWVRWLPATARKQRKAA